MITFEEAKVRVGAGGTITRAELDEVNRQVGQMTADDWHTLLHACPEWVAENDARIAARAVLEARLREEEAPLVADLADAGFNVNSVYDLVNSPRDYEGALPILVQHLLRSYDPRIREGIARALTVPKARGVAGFALVTVLRERDLDPRLRWPLANALAIAADLSILEDLRRLLLDRANADIEKALRRAVKRALKKS